MTPGRKDRASAGSLALIALPAACCIGHAACSRSPLGSAHPARRSADRLGGRAGGDRAKILKAGGHGRGCGNDDGSHRNRHGEQHTDGGGWSGKGPGGADEAADPVRCTGTACCQRGHRRGVPSQSDKGGSDVQPVVLATRTIIREHLHQPSHLLLSNPKERNSREGAGRTLGSSKHPVMPALDVGAFVSQHRIELRRVQRCHSTAREDHSGAPTGKAISGERVVVDNDDSRLGRSRTSDEGERIPMGPSLQGGMGHTARRRVEAPGRNPGGEHQTGNAQRRATWTEILNLKGHRASSQQRSEASADPSGGYRQDQAAEYHGK